VAGPRFWSGGIYPEGTAHLPVVGVSWQEADAYARWRGKQLPTWEQWWRAALLDDRKLPWGVRPDSTGVRANFNLEGADSAGAHPLGVSHVGAHDMAGNVREWLRSGRTDMEKRLAVGGSWQDPTYLFDPQWIEEFPPGYASELIGFRCVLESKGSQR
jgi:formylglycine-generating enzyme required for sulfatase activity